MQGFVDMHSRARRDQRSLAPSSVPESDAPHKITGAPLGAWAVLPIRVRNRAHLGSSWGVGIKKLGEFAGSAGTALGFDPTPGEVSQPRAFASQLDRGAQSTGEAVSDGRRRRDVGG